MKEKLTYNSDETDLESPVYVLDAHNKPDVRIDVYKNKVYIGSLILDMKCRRPESFFLDAI